MDASRLHHRLRPDTESREMEDGNGTGILMRCALPIPRLKSACVPCFSTCAVDGELESPLAAALGLGIAILGEEPQDLE
jgi:hypothetical protein